MLPADLRVLLVFRIVRFFKIARYSPAMRSLLDVLYRERRALFGCLVIALGSALVAAALMHLAEGKVQPDKLGTIPDALWWAIVTIGTIGYGDVVPVTALGKLIATATIFARPDHDGAAGRHHRHRLCRPDPPPRFHRHLGHDRARAAVCRARCRRDFRHHGAVARAGGGSRRR